MLIPDNEGKACDAVVRLLEMRTGEKRASLRLPEKDCIGPAVDLRLNLCNQEYAVEHTLIEPFEEQIRTGVVFTQINDIIKQKFLGPLPGLAFYELHVPVDACLSKKKNKRARALNNLVEWIQTSAQCLYKRNSGQSCPVCAPFQSDDYIQGKPEGFDNELELLRWPNAELLGRRSGELATALICPDDLEQLRRRRLARAFAKKFPKLQECKDEGMRTILILENRDTALTSFPLIGNQLPALLAEHTDSVDEIYLVESYTNFWRVWLMKRDCEHWPTVGMPQLNQTIYEPDKLPTAGLPESYRDMLQLDQLYTPQLSGWNPTTFEEKELNDLTSGCGSIGV